MKEQIISDSTEGGTRTHTFKRTLDFESSVSTNFTTSANILESNLSLNLFKIKIFYKARLNDI